IRLDTGRAFTGLHMEAVRKDGRAYEKQASKARTALNALFSLEEFVGTIDVPFGVQQYFARVDCYLIQGFEVVIDIDEAGIDLLEVVQLAFLRRLLNLSSRSPAATLFTETGIMPIRYRQIILALSYARYAVALPDSCYVKCAYLEAIALAANKERSWIGDFQCALYCLPHRVEADVDLFRTPEGIDYLVALVDASSCAQHLQSTLDGYKIVPFLQGRFSDANLKLSFKTVARVRRYLSHVLVPAHWKAVIAFVNGEHGLAVAKWRWLPTASRPPVHLQLCRLCKTSTEDEIHVLFSCHHPSLVSLRSSFFEDMSEVDEKWNARLVLKDPTRALRKLLNHKLIVPVLAKLMIYLCDY
ncbi:hypothetical protein BKA70DRAFT_1113671, partial [Coprinopsis sp. MPI-PUGE-AT-0042]